MPRVVTPYHTYELHKPLSSRLVVEHFIVDSQGKDLPRG